MTDDDELIEVVAKAITKAMRLHPDNAVFFHDEARAAIAVVRERDVEAKDWEVREALRELFDAYAPHARQEAGGYERFMEARMHALALLGGDEP